MKRNILIAAGLLSLGASPAFAFTLPPMAPDMAKAVKDVWAQQIASEQASLVPAGESWIGETKMPKAKSASEVTFGEALPAKSDGDTGKMAALGDPDLDLSVKPDDMIAKSAPSEPVMATTSLLAAAAYPACRPGAGDDHCIQLYEPGVRAQLAGWNRSASGTDSAMGGPYEPVDTTLAGELGGPDTTQVAMTEDDSSDPAMDAAATD